MRKMGKTEELVFSTLKNAEKGLTLAEIAERTGESEKKVFKALRKLFEEETIDCQNHQYRLVSK
jgi:DNA-binding transcriptional regulator GbsR (MarR family)